MRFLKKPVKVMKNDTSYEKNYLSYIHSRAIESKAEIAGKKCLLQEFIDKLTEVCSELNRNKGRIFFVGNGASAAFSNHMALDWTKNGGIRAYSMSDSSLITALSNDYSYESAFTKYLSIEKYSNKDLVVTISSSGNSPNIISVLEYCKKNKITSVGFSGLKSDNKSRYIADFSLYVPAKTYGMVECIHQVFLHLWLDKYMNIYEWNRNTIQNMSSEEFNL